MKVPQGPHATPRHATPPILQDLSAHRAGWDVGERTLLTRGLEF